MRCRFAIALAVLPTVALGQDVPAKTGAGPTQGAQVDMIDAGCTFDVGDVRAYRLSRDTRMRMPPSMGTRGNSESSQSVTVSLRVTEVSPESLTLETQFSNVEPPAQPSVSTFVETAVLSSTNPVRLRLDRRRKTLSFVDPEPWLQAIREAIANAADPDDNPKVVIGQISIFDRPDVSLAVLQAELNPVFLYSCLQYVRGENTYDESQVGLPDGGQVSTVIAAQAEGSELVLSTAIDSEFPLPKTGDTEPSSSVVHSRSTIRLDGAGWPIRWEAVGESNVRGIQAFERRSGQLVSSMEGP